jgi:hypothetical protein
VTGGGGQLSLGGGQLSLEDLSSNVPFSCCALLMTNIIVRRATS